MLSIFQDNNFYKGKNSFLLMFGSSWKNDQNKRSAIGLTNFLYDCSQGGIAASSPFHYADMGDSYRRDPSKLFLCIDCFQHLPEKSKEEAGRWKKEDEVYHMEFPHFAINFSGILSGCPTTWEFVSKPSYFTGEVRDSVLNYLRVFDKNGFVFNKVTGIENVAETILAKMNELSFSLQGRLLSDILQEPASLAGFSKGLSNIPPETRKTLSLSKEFQYVTDEGFNYVGWVDFKDDKVSIRDIRLKLPKFVHSADQFIKHFPFEIQNLEKGGAIGEIFMLMGLDFSGAEGESTLWTRWPSYFNYWEQWIAKEGGFSISIGDSDGMRPLIEIERAGKWLIKYEPHFGNIHDSHIIFST